MDDWLRTIRKYGGAQSPIIIVCNKEDVRPNLQLPEGRIQREFGVSEIVRLSCVTGANVDQLKLALRRSVMSLKHIDDLMLPSWFAVKRRLSWTSSPWISYRESREICVDNRIEDAKQQDLLMSLLHELGVAFNFRTDDGSHDDALEETNVLNPLWVTKAVSALLYSRQIRDNHGILRHGDFRLILSDPAYTDKSYRFIAGMMSRFELAFAFDSRDLSLLVPSELSDDEPGLGEMFVGASEYHIEAEMLHRSLLSRFIVRHHDHIVRRLYWRSGCVVKCGDQNLVLVRANYTHRRIELLVSGAELVREQAAQTVRRLVLDIDPSGAFDFRVVIAGERLSFDGLQRLRQRGRASHYFASSTRTSTSAMLSAEFCARLSRSSRRPNHGPNHGPGRSSIRGPIRASSAM